MEAPSPEQIAYAAWVEALTEADFERWLRGELPNDPYAAAGIEYRRPWEGPVIAPQAR